MKLKDKLDSITTDRIVLEIDQLLKANVTKKCLCNGRQIFFVEGYEGSATINHLAKTCLKSQTFSLYMKRTLKERIDCFNLWERIQRLEEDGINAKNSVKKSSLLSESDFGNYKYDILEFTPEEFKRIWPKSPPYGITFISLGRERWVATKEMVEEASKFIP